MDILISEVLGDDTAGWTTAAGYALDIAGGNLEDQRVPPRQSRCCSVTTTAVQQRARRGDRMTGEGSQWRANEKECTDEPTRSSVKSGRTNMRVAAFDHRIQV